MYHFRKPCVHRPYFDDSSSADEYRSTNTRLPLTTSDGHKAKVVRKSRKLRKQKALSFNCRQLSVAVQTESSSVIMRVGPQHQQPACDERLVSTSTQTDDVIVVSVSRQLHASSDFPDGLFKSGHSGLLPAIRTSDAHSASYDRDTDSGHMSDTESKLVTAADPAGKEVKKDSVVSSGLLSVSHGVEEMSGPAVTQDALQLAELRLKNDNWQLSKSAAMAAAMPPKLSSEHGPLSRWTTATRLDILDENDEGRVSTHPETFFAPLETSSSQLTALKDVDMSGISLLSKPRESHLPLPLPKSSSTHLHSDVIVSSSSGQSQSSAGARHVSKNSCSKTRPSNSSNGRTSRLSAGTRRRISKGSRQSRGKPRVSVGRKSLSKPQSAAIRDKFHPPTKISRPAAWLMNATKASRSKVHHCCVLSFLSKHLIAASVNGKVIIYYWEKRYEIF